MDRRAIELPRHTVQQVIQRIRERCSVLAVGKHHAGLPVNEEKPNTKRFGVLDKCLKVADDDRRCHAILKGTFENRLHPGNHFLIVVDTVFHQLPFQITNNMPAT